LTYSATSKTNPSKILSVIITNKENNSSLTSKDADSIGYSDYQYILYNNDKNIFKKTSKKQYSGHIVEATNLEILTNGTADNHPGFDS
jgi:hypothetical protein